MQAAAGGTTAILHRNDGKPEAANGKFVSASHMDDLTMAVASTSPVSCDFEKVVERSLEMWSDLLGDDGYAMAQRISIEINEDLNISATRVWSARECAKKCGKHFTHLLHFSTLEKDKMIKIGCEDGDIITLALSARFVNSTIVFGFLV
jgi:enediyne polyketide synthase